MSKGLGDPLSEIDTQSVIQVRPSQLTNVGTYFFGSTLTVLMYLLPSVFVVYGLSPRYLDDLLAGTPLTGLPPVNLVLMVPPLLWMLWSFLNLRANLYLLESERLIYTHGVTLKVHDEIELYRVKDFRVKQPLIYRLFGLSVIKIISSDRTHPLLVLNGIRDAGHFRMVLRGRVEKMRIARGVREFD